MTEKPENDRPYSYSFRLSPSANRSEEPSKAAREAVASVRETMLLLTSGCEVVERQDGVFCERHQRRVNEGDTRCDYIIERLASGQERSKAQIQQYVNDVLGVKDPKLAKRLTG